MLQILLLLACILTALLENYQVCFVSLFIKTQEDFLFCAINSVDCHKFSRLHQKCSQYVLEVVVGHYYFPPQV